MTFDFKDNFISLPLDRIKDILIYYFYEYKQMINLDFETWSYLIELCVFNNFLYKLY